MKLIYTTCFLIIFLMFLPAILIYFIKEAPNDFQPPLHSTEHIYADSTTSQSFLSYENDLSGIGISIKNPNLQNQKDIILQIYDQDNQLIRNVSINGSKIHDGQLVKFKFDPIKDSKDRVFKFTLQAPQEGEQTKSLEVFLTYEIPNWSRGLYINNNLSDASISFVTYHHIESPLLNIFNIYTKWWYKLSGDLPFLISYLTIFIGLMVLLTRSLLVDFRKSS